MFINKSMLDIMFVVRSQGSAFNLVFRVVLLQYPESPNEFLDINFRSPKKVETFCSINIE